MTFCTRRAACRVNNVTVDHQEGLRGALLRVDRGPGVGAVRADGGLGPTGDGLGPTGDGPGATGAMDEPGRPPLAAAPMLGTRAPGARLPGIPAPCDRPGSRVPRTDPPGGPGVAVALSGGGFRATLSGLGVLRLLADAGLLGEVRYASSVSGGSVANGLFAAAYPDLAAGGFTRPAFDNAVLRPFLDYVARRSLARDMLRQAWRLLGPATRTDLLARVLDERFFHGRRLADFPTGCRFIVNAANTTTSARFGFEREAVWDYVAGEVPTVGTGLRLAQAVAASAAVPGVLAPMVLRDLRLPCPVGPVRLVDGGVYDNMGLEPLDRLDSLLVVLNAGGMFRAGQRGRVPLLRDLTLAQSLLYRQTTALRRRELVDRFQAYERAPDDPPDWGRRGVLFQLTTTVDPGLAADWYAVNPRPPDPAAVAFLPTSFGRFSPEHCRGLVYAGWWLAGANLAAYHRGALPGQLPAWPDLP